MTTMEMERRTLPSDIEVRAAGDNEALIVGYAYKFGVRSQDLGGFFEVIAEGAGADSVKVDDIRALMNHDPNLILGRNRAGTLRLAEDSTGLHYEIRADRRQSYVRDLLIALERGDVTQSSFGFAIPPHGDTWSYDESGSILRTVHRMTLYDVSPVTYPAYLASEAQVSKRAREMARNVPEAVSPLPEYPRDVWAEAIALRARAARLRG